MIEPTAEYLFYHTRRSGDSLFEELTPLYRELRFGPAARRREVASKRRPDGLISFLSIEDRRSVQWRTLSEQYLRKIEDYSKSDHKDEVAAFIKITGLYASLIEITPLGSPGFEATVGAMLKYVGSSITLREAPHIWTSEVRRFLRRGTLDEHEQGQKEIRRMVRNQANFVLLLLVDLDEVNPPKSVL